MTAGAPRPPIAYMAPGIPFARPIAVPVALPYAPIGEERPLSAIRAVVEIILVAPLAFIGGVAGIVIAKACAPADERWIDIAFTLGLGGGAAVACMLLVRLGGRRLNAIGLTTRNLPLDLGIGIASLIGMWSVLILCSLVIAFWFPSLLEKQSEAQQAIETYFPRLSVLQMFVLCACVAAYEEIVFRGFLLTRLHAIARRWWLVVPIGAILFGSLHFYEGPIAVSVVTVLGLVMGLLFVWRKSLAAPITMHLLHNFFMFMLLHLISKTWQ